MKHIILIFAVIFFSCANTKKPVAEIKNVTYKSLVKNNNGGFENPTTRIITAKSDFEDIWHQAWNRTTDKPKVPVIDFSKKQVLLIALGAKNNGGYGLKIDNIITSKKGITVNYLETKSGKECMTTQAIIFPFELIEIDKSPKKITFNSSEKIIDCN